MKSILSQLSLLQGSYFYPLNIGVSPNWWSGDMRAPPAILNQLGWWFSAKSAELLGSYSARDTHTSLVVLRTARTTPYSAPGPYSTLSSAWVWRLYMYLREHASWRDDMAVG